MISHYMHCARTRGVEISTYGIFLFTKVKLLRRCAEHTSTIASELRSGSEFEIDIPKNS